ncbi:tRNA lysidine(34) synthetase TilS [Bacillota bacterium]
MITAFIEKVRKTIEKNGLIERGDGIVVGLSGGPDSVCLISVLNDMAGEWDLLLKTVHINHCLRGDDADGDQHYTEELCRKLGIQCYVFRYDVNALSAKLKITSEEAGRQVRYEAFEKIRRDMGASTGIDAQKVKIAVAHNMNDQAETLLMRIIRGTGTEGLAGMEYSRDGIIIRPLLDVTRDEIEEYCKELNLQPRTDHSNMEPLYTRNRIRLELLPLLKNEYNVNIVSALSRLARIAGEDRDYFQTRLEAMQGIAKHDEEAGLCRIGREDYGKLHPALGKRLLSAEFKEMGLIQDITAVHLDGADNLMRRGKAGDRMDFPRKYGLRLEYEKGVLFKQDGSPGSAPAVLGERFVYGIKINGTIRIPELKASMSAKMLNKAQNIKRPEKTSVAGRHSICLDISKVRVPDSIVVRSRMPGDYIIPSGMKGRKKLQDFFTDKKIPERERDLIPLVCIGKEVMWIIGYRVSENYIINSDTSEILYLEYESAMW